MVIAFVLALGMMSSLVACGSFELTSIVVTQDAIKKAYRVGDTVSFDGIKIKAKFNDGSEQELKLSDVKVLLNDEDISSNLSKITETKGSKRVVIEYENKTDTITIKVRNAGDNPAGEILSYGLPTSYSSYEEQTKDAGTIEYDTENPDNNRASSFESQFTTGDETAKDYLVGDDNIFRFIPRLRYEDYADEELYFAPTFKSITTIKYNNDKLTTQQGTVADTVEYYLDSVLMVTAYTLKNEYQFTQNAIGKQFELSILPVVDEDFYWGITENAVTATVNVVDGYNIYEAYQLAVIDNGENQNDRKDNTSGNYFWTDVKEKNGLLGINPKAVILQNDINLTKNDIPAYFKYDLTEDVTFYKNDQPINYGKSFLPEEVATKGGTHHLTLFQRFMQQGDTFAIHGNYHSLDFSNLPILCPFETQFSRAFGYDGSNANFLRVTGTGENSENTYVGDFTMSNLDVIGNANIDATKYKESGKDDVPVYAGGLIFSKFTNSKAVLDNVIVHTAFIPFFPDSYSKVDILNSKAYDSFNGAIFTYNKTELNIENSNMERAGGPLILSQVEASNIAEYTTLAPIVTVDDNSILNNPVTGYEFWFKSKGADQIVSKLAPLDYRVFDDFQRKIFNKENPNDKNEQGKLNLIYAIMPSGGIETVTLWQTQGLFTYKGTALDRIYTDQVNHMFGAATAGILQMAAGQTTDPTDPVIGMTFNAGSSFGYMADANTPVFAIPTSPTTGIPVDTASFLTSDYIALNYGGFGLFLQFYPVA